MGARQQAVTWFSAWEVVEFRRTKQRRLQPVVRYGPYMRSAGAAKRSTLLLLTGQQRIQARASGCGEIWTQTKQWLLAMKAIERTAYYDKQEQFKAQMRSRLPHAQNLLHAGKSWPLWLVSASTGLARQLLAMKAIERTAYYDKQEQFKAQMRSRLP